jgi:cytochrome c-type biogenesis protein CcmH
MVVIKKVILLASLFMLPVFSSTAFFHPVSAQQLNVDELAEDFFCMCGCNMLLSVCESQMTCSTAGNMKGEIRNMIGQGLSKDDIINNMINTYGNTVLAVPPMKGFSLALWWYPVIGGALGVIAITLISRRRSDVNWRLDPDDVTGLDEEELLKQIDNEPTTKVTVEKKYEDILKEKLKSKKE